MKTEFILIDFENVQPKNMIALVGGLFKIKVFLGAAQSKIPLEMARALQAFGPDAEYIQIDGHGSNALDFHIAYYIGRLVAEWPDASYCIVSKDTGFDPLIKHLKAQKISCRRSASVADIGQPKHAPALPPPAKTGAPAVPPPAKTGAANASHARRGPAGPPPARIDAIITNLTKRAAAKPRKLKTLSATIRLLFANALSDEELHDLLDQLTQRGIIKVADGKVSYTMP
ncbi:MAG: PIN domain-containing protein [bacterium]|nr:PIN domain-containing protein [bacterium]